MYVKVQGREDKQESAHTVWPGSPSTFRHCTTEVVSIEGVQANFEAFEKGYRVK